MVEQLDFWVNFKCMCGFTLSMRVAALDVLTVMDTIARVMPTAATTNT